MINPKLENKVVLITGANHGIGAATAIAFAEQKARVFITFLRIHNEERTNTKEYKENQAKNAEEVITKIKSMGGVADSMEIDLSNSDNITKLFDHVDSKFGSVDILVNNAAYCVPDTFEINNVNEEKTTGLRSNSFSAHSHDSHFAVNSRAVALLMEEYLLRHKKRNAIWGRIVNVSTDAADCFPTEISYGASKAALESYSRSAAVEMGKYGITVNIVSPGPIQTGWMTKEVEQVQANKSLIGRIGNPKDVADVIVFLASEQARWLTGQRLFVGGGNRIV